MAADAQSDARSVASRSVASNERRRVPSRRIRFFVAATITYNVIEAVVALAAGTAASSSALVGFGLDSVIEVSSAPAVAWHFAGRDPESRDKKALRFYPFSFFALAAFVTVDARRSLSDAREPDHSTVGLVLSAVSLAIRPLLSGRSAARAGNWAHDLPWPIPNRPCFAPVCSADPVDALSPQSL